VAGAEPAGRSHGGGESEEGVKGVFAHLGSPVGLMRREECLG
jgi:hypothetical protein